MSAEDSSNALTIENLQIVISSESTKAAKSITPLTEALQSLKTVTRGGISGLNSVAKQLNKLNAAISATDLKKLKEIRDVLGQIRQIGNVGISTAVNTSSTIPAISDIQNTSAVPIIGGTESGSTETNLSDTYGLQEFLQELQEVNEEIEETENQLERNLSCFNEVGKAGKRNFRKIWEAAQEANTGATGFFKALQRIVRYKIVSGIIRGIVSSFKTGLQNIAQYSSEANYTLSQLSTTSLQLKNTAGATLMPIIEGLAPLFMLLAQGAMYLLNALNMLMAVMAGKGTYTKAIAYWQDYAKSVNDAKKALTGFDEINILGESSVDYSSMFEETEVSIGNMAGGLAVLTAAVAGLSALGAVMQKSGLAGFISNLKLIGGLLLTIIGYAESIQGFLDIWNEGAEISNVNQLILGLTASVAGLTLAFGKTGATIGTVIAAVALLTAGIKDMISNGVNINNVSTVVAGLGTTLVAVGLIVSKFNSSLGITLGIVGAIVTVAALLINNLDGMSREWKIAIAVLGTVAAAALAAAAAYLALHGASTMGVVVPVIVAAVAAGVVGITAAVKAAQFANGGFPEDGQLFIANEAGPELVGTMNGHAAVANNMQIVDGIKQGVIEALSDSDFGGDWTINLVENGKIKATQIITAAQRKNTRDGKTVIQLGT